MMQTKLGRFSSFSQFPTNIQVYVTNLARDGFFYTGQGAVVQCACCGFQWNNWLSTNCISNMHQEASPQCAFVSVGNSDQGRKTTGDDNGVQICCQKQIASDCPAAAIPNGDNINTAKSADCAGMNSQNCSIEKDGYNITTTPRIDNARFPEFSEFSRRRSSFAGWPDHIRQKPYDLALAGFFYTGVGDTVKCFACGGGLKEWEPEDVPFEEHASWFPECRYMREYKSHHIQDFKKRLEANELDNDGASANENHQEKQCNDVTFLNSPAAESVIEMGYSKEEVLSAFQQALRNGNRQPNATDVMEIIIDQEDRSSSGATMNPAVKIPDDHERLPTCIEDLTQNTNLTELEEENRLLKEKRLCKICLDDNTSIVFLPCGHLCTCAMCAPALRHCPICRTFIRGTMKTVLA